jgi:putative addiction module killer protein
MQTEQFKSWLKSLKDEKAKNAINKRFIRISNGLFGDHKRLSNASGLYELRISTGKGYRVYYMRKGDLVVFLLCGGNKATQIKDIKKAKQLAGDVEL